MALPRWLAKTNRTYLNPRVVKRGRWPILIHEGRKSGRIYRTPLDVFHVDGGMMFTVNYGPRTDWVRNVIAAGKAQVEISGETIEITDPLLIPAEDAYRLLPAGTKTPPAFVGVEQCLLVRPVETARAETTG